MGVQILGNQDDIVDGIKEQRAKELAQEMAAGTQGVPAASHTAKRSNPTGMALLDAIGGSEEDANSQEMTLVELPVGGVDTEFYVRLLSSKEENELLGDAPRVAGLITVMGLVDEEQAVDAMAIARCLFTAERDEETNEPTYYPVFTFPMVYGQQEVRNSKNEVVVPRVVGLFERKDHSSKTFAKLALNQIYQVNPAISPMLKKMTQQLLVGAAVAHQSQK
jgi:hypothetical protein